MRKISFRLISILTMTAAMLLVSACGQKGDLYLPEQGSLVEEDSDRHT